MSNFAPSGLGLSIFKERYARTGEEDWEGGCHRLARVIAAAEPNGKSSEIEERFFSELSSGYFMPGGRTWYGAGRPTQQLLNCFVLRAEDSREGWGKAISDVIVTCGMGGGVGFNMSPIRGRNYPIRRMGGEATGSVSLMNMINTVGDELVGGGGRRLALMLCLDVNHPDIEEFLNAKLDLHKLQNANISIIIPADYDTKRFVKDVKANKEIPLVFGGMDDVFGRKVKAGDLWNTIVKNAHKSGEPGVLNGFLANEQNNVYYAHSLVSTNPCQPSWAPVLTHTGISTIGDITIGSTIWSGKRWTKVVNKMYTGKKPIYQFVTRAGSFFGTNEHRVVSDGVKVEAQHASSIDVSRGPLPYLKDFDYQTIMDGLLIGDGGVHKASGNLIGLYIGKNDGDYFKSEIGEYIGKHRPGISEEFYEIKTEMDVNYLRKTHERIIPREYFYADGARKRGFLRGLYSANGSVVADGRRITLKSASLKLIERVQSMLSSLGIQSYYTVNKSKTVKFKNGDYTCKQSYDLNISTDRKVFKEYIGFLQEYKMAKISIDSSNSGASKKSYGVVDKIELGEEHVWDITVDDEDHTYWSGGLLVSNCGEIWLPSMGCCCLGALVLPRFIKNGKVDWDKLDETVRVSVRFLDNVLTVNNYPLPEIKDMCEKERRIGLGVMGLHSMLMDLGLPYESQDSFDFVDKLFEKIKISAYHASVDLAIEKGPFPLYNHKMLDSGFMKGMKNSVKRRVKEYGVRNCALLTIAPTGTTSMVHGVTGGIEPLFAPAYIRRRFMKTDKAGEKKTIETLVVSKDYTDHPEIAQGAYDVSVRGHFEMQKVCQKHIDNATSKTINLPKDFPVSELSDIWLEYLDCMKGATFYREGSRENEPMSPIPLKQAKKIIESWGGETEFEQNYSLDCSKGTCDLPLP